MVSTTGYARFFRKVPDIYELRRLTAENSGIEPMQYIVAAPVTMPDEQFSRFCKSLLSDNGHINEFTHLCGEFTPGVVSCIAVTSSESDDIVLVNAEGYDYAKYAALISKAGMGKLKRSDIVSTLRALSDKAPDGAEVLMPVPLYRNQGECDAAEHEDGEFKPYDVKFLLQFIADMME